MRLPLILQAADDLHSKLRGETREGKETVSLCSPSLLILNGVAMKKELHSMGISFVKILAPHLCSGYMLSGFASHPSIWLLNFKTAAQAYVDLNMDTRQVVR